MHLLQTHNSWIIDSGATYHICSNQYLFVSLTKLIRPQSLVLPNGQGTFVNYIGDVEIHDSITLHGVLYVPEFKYNLVSIPKLTSHLKTFAIFTDENCLLHVFESMIYMCLNIINLSSL